MRFRSAANLASGAILRQVQSVHHVPVMTDDAERIIDLYERHAETWDRERWRNLFERPWLDRFLALIRRGGSIVDRMRFR
jgi:hypothetical protein